MPSDLRAKPRQVVDTRARLIHAWRTPIRQAAQRVVDREIDGVRSVMREAYDTRDSQAFAALLRAFYLEFGATVYDLLVAVTREFGAVASNDAAGEIGMDPMTAAQLDAWLRGRMQIDRGRWTGGSFAQLLALVREAEIEGLDPVAALTTRLDAWQAGKAHKWTLGRATEQANDAAVTTYKIRRIRRIRWKNVATTCPYCTRLDGRTVAVGGAFHAAGDSIQPDGAAPLTFKRTMRYPPAHLACDCVVRAAG